MGEAGIVVRAVTWHGYGLRSDGSDDVLSDIVGIQLFCEGEDISFEFVFMDPDDAERTAMALLDSVNRQRRGEQ